MKTASAADSDRRSRPARPTRRRVIVRRTFPLIAEFAVAGIGIGAPAASAAAPASCQPQSGAHLAEHHFTAEEVSKRPDFSCADLRGASLAGLSLVQLDFSGADLTGATLTAADLSQAEMTGADLSTANLRNAQLVQTTLNDATLSGTNLSGARMDQAELRQAVLTGADLSNADLAQADLTDATVDGANLSGTGFIQTTVTNAKFQGATGVIRWDNYLAIAAVVLLALMTLGLLVQLRRTRPVGTALVRAVVFGFAGRLALVLALHFILGGLLGLFGSTFGGPLAQMCTGPQCAVGVGRGFYGPFIGVGLLIAAILVLSAGRPRMMPVSPLPPEPY